MIKEKNLEKAKKLIKKSEERPIIVQAQNNFFNRKILEFGNFDILEGLEYLEEEQDKIKKNASAFNHILAKIAQKNSISLGFDLARFNKLKINEKAKILARFRQNIFFTKKKNLKIKILNYSDEKNARAFLESLGFPTKKSARSIN